MELSGLACGVQGQAIDRWSNMQTSWEDHSQASRPVMDLDEERRKNSWEWKKVTGNRCLDYIKTESMETSDVLKTHIRLKLGDSKMTTGRTSSLYPCIWGARKYFWVRAPQVVGSLTGLIIIESIIILGPTNVSVCRINHQVHFMEPCMVVLLLNGPHVRDWWLFDQPLASKQYENLYADDFSVLETPSNRLLAHWINSTSSLP